MAPEIVVPVAVSLLLPLILHFYVTQVRLPGWHKRVSWGKANSIAVLSAIVFALAVSTLSFYGNIHWATGMALASATALLTYVMMQSFYTDPPIRKADKGTLMLAVGLAVPISITYYVTHFEYLGWYEFFGWVAAVLIGLALIYAPGLGASDGRAFALVAASSIPAIGFLGLVFGFVLYMVIGVVYVIIAARKEKLGLTQINRVSIPAVPYILLPFVVMVIFTVLNTVLLTS